MRALLKPDTFDATAVKSTSQSNTLKKITDTFKKLPAFSWKYEDDQENKINTGIRRALVNGRWYIFTF